MADGWPAWKLALLLYVFVAAALAINLFMLGLLVQAFGLGPLSPMQSLTYAAPLAIPVAFAAGLWVRRLLDQASD